MIRVGLYNFKNWSLYLNGREFNCDLNSIGSNPIKDPPNLHMFLFDPLEQFSIDFIGSYFSNVVHSGNINLNRVFFFNFVFLFFLIYSNKSILVHNKFQKMIVLLFHFVSTTLKDSVSIKKYSFILLLYTVFLFIFISNILGMIPYSITLTSHLILTL
jgi:F-type H+-transporting ATPase subunit a